MNTAASLINPNFILMVIRQIREQPLDARSLATLVLAAGCAAVMFLHAAPAGGNDIALEAACLATGEFACQGPEVDPLALVAHGTQGVHPPAGQRLGPDRRSRRCRRRLRIGTCLSGVIAAAGQKRTGSRGTDQS